MSSPSLHAHAAEIKRPGNRPGLKLVWWDSLASDAAAVVAAPTVNVPLDVLLVTCERSVLRHAHFLGGGVKAFAGVRCFFHFRSHVGHECNLLLHVLPGAKPAARPGMTWDHTLP